MPRSLLIVTFVIAAVLHSILAQAQTQPQCTSIFKKACKVNADCACSGPRKFICNYKSQCNRISILDIMMRQPCPRVFKSSCVTDADCPCKTRKLICEDRECVKARRNGSPSTNN